MRRTSSFVLLIVVGGCAGPSTSLDADSVAAATQDCVQVSRLANFRLTWFFTEFRCRVKKTWKSEVCVEERGRDAKTLLNIQIRRDGSLHKVEVAQSSGRSTEDQAAVAAVIDASPFSKPPSQLIADDGKVTFRLGFQCSGRVPNEPTNRSREKAARRISGP